MHKDLQRTCTAIVFLIKPFFSFSFINSYVTILTASFLHHVRLQLLTTAYSLYKVPDILLTSTYNAYINLFFSFAEPFIL